MKREILTVALALSIVLLLTVFVSSFSFSKSKQSPIDNTPIPSTGKLVISSSLVRNYACNDSDGGIYSETKGFTSVKVISMLKKYIDEYDLSERYHGDRCLNDKILQERYCVVNGTVKTVQIKCPNGCLDRACIPNQPQARCGNGIVESGEECDGSVLVDQTQCQSESNCEFYSDCFWYNKFTNQTDFSDCGEGTDRLNCYISGNVQCNSNCKRDLSRCAV